jgi:TetR/AcrR family transcriptional regulator, cholesterol catabolism regulator
VSKKSKSRKEEIIRVAAKLFREKGYSAVTMRDLATTMGIKAASLYNHISSKQEILQIIVIALAEEFTSEMKSIQSSNASCIDKLNKIIQLHVKLSSQNSYGMACLNNDWMHLEDQLEHYKLLRTAYEDDFRKILEDGISSGEIINVKPEIMMFSILTTLRSLYVWIPKKEDINLQELSKTLSKILITGINK